MSVADLIKNKIDHLWFRLILLQFTPVDSIMDIGCGENPQTFIQATGDHYIVDPVAPEIRGNKYKRVFGTWEHQALDMLSYSRIHTVLLFDVVEHIEKEKAVELLEETKKHVKQIVVFTPLGFLPQEDGRWNTHRSMWCPGDFAGWNQVYVLRHFHWCNHKGEPFDKPHGAILAILNQ